MPPKELKKLQSDALTLRKALGVLTGKVSDLAAEVADLKKQHAALAGTAGSFRVVEKAGDDPLSASAETAEATLARLAKAAAETRSLR
jgi:hypothetical protein